MSRKFSVEFEGRTVGEAIKKALKELKVKRGQVKIEILSDEEKGLFGMEGASPAIIKVSLLDKEKS